MSDDPDWWPKPWVYEVERKKWREQAKQEAEEHKKQLEETRRRRAAGEDVRWELRKARWEEFKDNPKQRKWAMWKEYKAGGTTLKKVGENFGITQERVRQSNAKCERILRTALNRDILTFPVIDEVREATLGVEFVFRNDLTFNVVDGDQKGWTQLELTLHDSSIYRDPVPWWKPEWGLQDTSPAKPVPAYTYYKTIIKKEQSDGD